jgi:hypothetical protein
MMGIKFPRPLRQGTAALPVAAIGHQETLIGGSVSIHGVQSDGSFRCISESLAFAQIIKDRSQSVVGEVIGWRGLGRAPSGCERPSEWIGPGVEPVNDSST